jgi:Transcription factor WhiB
MTAELAHLHNYRATITDAAREAGEQAALSFAREWSEIAWDELVDLARSRADFTAYDLVDRAGAPTSPGAVGAVIRQASRQGLIEAVGYTTSRRISRHNGLHRIWRGTGLSSWTAIRSLLGSEDYVGSWGRLIAEIFPLGRWDLWWLEMAACRNVEDPDAFFRGGLAAQRICSSCSVRPECRDYIDTLEEQTSHADGLWGGENPAERKRRRLSS